MDGKQFAALQHQTSYTISVGPPSQADGGTLFSTNKSDGLGLAWLPDGRLLSQDSRSRFWLTATDGKDRVMAFDARGDVWSGDFSICGGASFMVLARMSGGIWRVDTTGKDFQAVSRSKLDLHPDCSPDGNWIVYSSGSEKGFSLTKVSVSGGSPENLSERPFPRVVGRYSPDGKKVGLLMAEGEPSNMHTKLAVMDSRTGSVERTFEIPSGGLPANVRGGLRWTSDGQELTFPLVLAGTTNLWIQSVSGGPPRQLTHSGHIVSFAWSPDGKRLAVTRATTSSDLVLFSNFH